MMHEISQRITWTIRLLMGGTPVILYGDELGLKQVLLTDKPAKSVLRTVFFSLEELSTDALGDR